MIHSQLIESLSRNLISLLKYSRANKWMIYKNLLLLLFCSREKKFFNICTHISQRMRICTNSIKNE